MIMQGTQQTKQTTDSQRPRRINGMLVLVLVVAGLIFASYKPSVARIHCNEEILNSKPEVIMLGAWWCPYCYQARRYLTDNNISYCEYDIERSAEGEKLFNDINGQAIPVLLIDKYIINGFEETQLERVLRKTREAS